MFTEILDDTYRQELESGELCPRAFYTEYPNPAEPIEVSIRARNIFIGRNEPYSSELPHTSKDWYHNRDSLFGEFLMDKLRSGKFFLDVMAVHAHTFHFCVSHMLEGPSRISRDQWHHE